MAKKATSQDVAVLAGVSRSAVSFVFNGKADGNIAKDKQDRILSAAKELNYEPNALARSLQSQRSNTIGFVTDSIAGGAFAGKLLQGASSKASESGYLLLVIDTQGQQGKEDGALNTLLNRQADALIYASMSLREHAPRPAFRMAPAVMANCFDPKDTVRAVIPDEIAGGRAAAQLLLDAGHHRIAFLTGGSELIAAERRTVGFHEAIAAAGLAPIQPLETGWEINDGYAAAMRLLSKNNDGGNRTGTGPNRPTGLICANDRVAVGAMLACGALGLRVPHDVSIVGYDDDEPLARTTVPGLTTIALPHRKMGELAIDLALEQLALDRGALDRGQLALVQPERTAESPQEATPSFQPIMVPCPAVIRDSVAPPAP